LKATKASQHAASRGVSWLTWRVITHPRIADSVLDVCRSWSLPDLLRAHLALDAIETIEAIAAKPPPGTGSRRGRR